MSLFDINISCENNEDEEYITYEIVLIRKNEYTKGNVSFNCILEHSREKTDPSELCLAMQGAIHQLFEVHEMYAISKKSFLERFFDRIKSYFRGIM